MSATGDATSAADAGDDRGPTVLRSLIVDDEAPARDELRFLLDAVDAVEVVGAAATAAEATVLIDALDYDVVFLDIHMPGMNGIEFARQLQSRSGSPSVVFTTAHPDFAVEAFDTDAVAYLLKPLDPSKLAQAIAKIRGRSTRSDSDSDSDAAGAAAEGRSGPAPRTSRIPVQRGDRTVFVDEADVVLASAARGYSYLQLASERVLVNFSLTDLEARLSGAFARVHRSYLVNLDRVRELRPDFSGGVLLVMEDDQQTEVKVARRQAATIRKRLGL